MSGSLSFDMLFDGSLVLTVGEPCVRTAAGRARRKSAALLGARAAEVPLGLPADTRERRLSTIDFAAFRAEHPELASGPPASRHAPKERGRQHAVASDSAVL